MSHPIKNTLQVTSTSIYTFGTKLCFKKMKYTEHHSFLGSLQTKEWILLVSPGKQGTKVGSGIQTPLTLFMYKSWRFSNQLPK